MEVVEVAKLEVYKAAVESAFEAGGIDDKERRMLAGMRRKLGLRDLDAEAVERDVREALGVAPEGSAPTGAAG
ncbi:MAG: hypothetical protein ACYDCK_05040 [Thermoplasmatota archaeon]